MQRLTTPKDLVDEVKRDNRIPRASRIKESLRHIPEGDSVFYAFDAVYSSVSDQRDFKKILEEVRMMVAEILQSHGSEVHRAVQLWNEDQLGDQSRYNAKRRLVAPDNRLFRQTSSVHNYGRFSCITEGFPKFNRDHPYVVSEEMHRLNEKIYLTFTPDRSNAVTLEDCHYQLSSIERVKVILDTMIACNSIHKKEEAHCDIKPANIFVRKDHRGLVGNLFDLEMRRLCHDTSNGLDVGDWRYTHPDFSDSHSTVPDFRYNDLFALGMTLWQVRSHATQYKEPLMKAFNNKRLLSLDDYVAKMAPEVGLNVVSRNGSMFVEFPEDYAPSHFAQSLHF